MSFPEKIIERTDLRTVVQKAAYALKEEGFALVTELKLGPGTPEGSASGAQKSSILLACNPVLAYKAISLDSRSGVLLTSRIALREHDNGDVSVSTFNPLECMDENMATSPLEEVSVEVTLHLRRAVERLQLRETE